VNLFHRPIRRWTAILVILCLTVAGIGPATAGLAPSRATGTTTITSARDADMLAAQRALENKIVAQKLQDYGVTPADAKARLASMSDKDLHTLASASKGLPSGGDAAGGLIGVLVVVILVIVILRLTHHDVIVR
jgi:predicted PurR-regulated permease PerM